MVRSSHQRQNRSKNSNSLQSSILSKLKKSKLGPHDSRKLSTPNKDSTKSHATSGIKPDSIRDELPNPNSTLDSKHVVSFDTLNENLDETSIHHEKRDRPDEEESEISHDETVESKSNVKKIQQDIKKNQQDRNQEIEKITGFKASKPRHQKDIISDGAELISEFHRIEKKLSQPNLDPLTRRKLKIQMKKLGGLEVYQTASKIGGSIQNGGETGKWCAKTLIQLGLRSPAHLNTAQNNNKKIKLLDVGAIDGKSYSKFQDWISTTSIDLNPIDELNVLKFDFFEFPLPQKEEEKFDVVCLSLVLNFVGDLKKRGEMIQRARKFLKLGGHLFIVLPLACLNNSRYLDSSRFEKILNYLGFKLIVQHDSSKLTHWFLENLSQDQHRLVMQQQDNENLKDLRFKNELDHKSHQFKKKLKFPKVEIRSGLNRNNFCIKV